MEKIKRITMKLGSQMGTLNHFEKTFENLKSLEDGINKAKEGGIHGAITYIFFYEHNEAYDGDTHLKSEEKLVKKFYFGKVVSIEEIKKKTKENPLLQEIVDHYEQLGEKYVIDLLNKTPRYERLDEITILLDNDWSQIYPEK